VRAAKHGVANEIACRHAARLQARANRGFKISLDVIEREFDFA
jgi:hypothetical protein